MKWNDAYEWFFVLSLSVKLEGIRYFENEPVDTRRTILTAFIVEFHVFEKLGSLSAMLLGLEPRHEYTQCRQAPGLEAGISFFPPHKLLDVVLVTLSC